MAAMGPARPNEWLTHHELIDWEDIDRMAMNKWATDGEEDGRGQDQSDAGIDDPRAAAPAAAASPPAGFQRDRAAQPAGDVLVEALQQRFVSAARFRHFHLPLTFEQ